MKMSNRIVQIRGCNGSGKTTIVRRFLERLPSQKLGKNPSKPWGYKVDATAWGICLPIYVIGSYENVCGGLDGINTQEEATTRIVQAHSLGHVLAEGLLSSKSSAGGHMAPILKDHGAIFAFLNTPWNVCLERVLGRRAAAGNEKPFDPDKTMKTAYEQCHRSYELLSEAGGYDVRWLDWEDPITHVVSYLKEAENV